MNGRKFRSDQSLLAEGITRAMVPDFLRDRGFMAVRDIRERHGVSESQRVIAITPDGDQISMRVTVSWVGSRRQRGKGANSMEFNCYRMCEAMTGRGRYAVK